jgi:curved DNA-binding protein CbpA
MPSKDELLGWVKVAATKSYYDILRVNKKSPPADIKKAFHRFALLVHPDQFSDQPLDVRAAASEAFKRGVEAYRVLSSDALRDRYNRGLAKGKLRLDEHAVSEPPPPPKERTLEDCALTKKGKELARRADRMVLVGKYDEARVLLATAIQEEPDNDELRERLHAVYQMMAR